MELFSYKQALYRKLYLLYALNISDWLCTLVLLRTGRFYEANPLMRPFVGSIGQSFLLKGVLPAAILLPVKRLMERLDIADLIRTDRFIAFALTVYTALCIGHTANFVLWFLQVRA